MIKKPTNEQIKAVAGSIYSCLDEEQLFKVVEICIEEWEKIRDLEIRPCKCRASDLDVRAQSDDMEGIEYVVKCKTCGKIVVGKTKQEAIEVWNKRMEE